jgi:hypothetical protein
MDVGDNSFPPTYWTSGTDKGFDSFLVDSITEHTTGPTTILSFLKIEGQTVTPTGQDKSTDVIITWSIVGGIFFLVFMAFVIIYCLCKK